MHYEFESERTVKVACSEAEAFYKFEWADYAEMSHKTKLNNKSVRKQDKLREKKVRKNDTERLHLCTTRTCTKWTYYLG